MRLPPYSMRPYLDHLLTSDLYNPREIIGLMFLSLFFDNSAHHFPGRFLSSRCSVTSAPVLFPGPLPGRPPPFFIFSFVRENHSPPLATRLFTGCIRLLSI